MNLDEKLNKLKNITEKLESGSVGIEEGIKLFEEGTVIAKECYTALNEAKGKITQIKKQMDETITEEGF